MRIVIAGVSGSGKTTIGKMVAGKMGCGFADADDFHPLENIAKMAAGIPLDDADRSGWLEALGHHLASADAIVLACSALKRTYRDRLRAIAGPVRFFALTADRSVLEARLRGREHFMPASLLDSQLAAFEPGDDMVEIENLAAPEEAASLITASCGGG